MYTENDLSYHVSEAVNSADTAMWVCAQVNRDSDNELNNISDLIKQGLDALQAAQTRLENRKRSSFLNEIKNA
jgi:hypothetical protein